IPPAPPPTHTLSLHDALPICRLVLFRRVEQRLGGNAADVEAGAARRALAGAARHPVDARGFQAELGGANGGHVSAGSAADDDDIDRKSTRLNSSHVKSSYAVF